MVECPNHAFFHSSDLYKERLTYTRVFNANVARSRTSLPAPTVLEFNSIWEMTIGK